MIAIAFLFVCVLCDYFKSRRRLKAEILVFSGHTKKRNFSNARMRRATADLKC